MWYHMMNDYGWGWGMGGMLVGMVLFWVVFIAAIVMLVRCMMRCGGAGQRSDAGRRQRENTALDILKERYARGEIEREEFEQKKRDLQD